MPSAGAAALSASRSSVRFWIAETASTSVDSIVTITALPLSVDVVVAPSTMLGQLPARCVPSSSESPPEPAVAPVAEPLPAEPLPVSEPEPEPAVGVVSEPEPAASIGVAEPEPEPEPAWDPLPVPAAGSFLQDAEIARDTPRNKQARRIDTLLVGSCLNCYIRFTRLASKVGDSTL